MKLLSGGICLAYNCSLCCHNTEMPLTHKDIERLIKLGYQIEEFTIKDGEIYRLRNINGKCYFLDEKGLCKVYEFRPLGCRAYPIIVVNDSCQLDSEICPYTHLADEEDFEKGCKLAKKVIKSL